MENQINLKDLWQKQTASPPNIEELTSKLNQLKKSNLRRIIITNLLLLATCGFMVFIWYSYQPKLITTKIGIILMILTMVIYLIAYNLLFPAFKNIDAKQSNAEYLRNLIAIKTKQQFLNSTMLSVYYVLLFAGLCLYLYEYTALMPTFWMIFTYAATSAWVLFGWFYFRPKTIKKQNQKIDEMISKFEKINEQLKD